MKATKILYWVFTGLFSILCVYGSIIDIIHTPDAIQLIAHLGYPLYFMTFIGLVRLFGVIAILIPGYPRIKEWAYAGLVFDMGGALYSHLAVNDTFNLYAPAALALVLALGCYIYYRKRFGRISNHFIS